MSLLWSLCSEYLLFSGRVSKHVTSSWVSARSLSRLLYSHSVPIPSVPWLLFTSKYLTDSCCPNVTVNMVASNTTDCLVSVFHCTRHHVEKKKSKNIFMGSPVSPRNFFYTQKKKKISLHTKISRPTVVVLRVFCLPWNSRVD